MFIFFYILSFRFFLFQLFRILYWLWNVMGTLCCLSCVTEMKCEYFHPFFGWMLLLFHWTKCGSNESFSIRYFFFILLLLMLFRYVFSFSIHFFFLPIIFFLLSLLVDSLYLSFILFMFLKWLKNKTRRITKQQQQQQQLRDTNWSTWICYSV